MRSLVIYYSRSGNTRFVAERISQEIGADTEEIIDKKKRKGIFGFILSGYDATRGRLTKVAEMKRSLKDYDLIVIGTPMWNKRITPAVRTYLRDNNFSEKRIALFCTSLGSEPERVFRTLKELMPRCRFVGELAITSAQKDREKTEERISEWSKSLMV
jgi:flavodoxin